MAVVNGLTRVNGGKVIEVEGREYELLGKNGEYSTHTHNIICDYFMTEGKKVVLTYSDTNTHEVYFYKDETDNHFYRSASYTEENLPEKYRERAEKLKRLHREFF